MNLNEFKSAPSVMEHWGQLGPHVESLLIDHLVETADGSTGHADKAEAEVGALKAIAHVIKIFRQVERKPGVKNRDLLTKPLHRNATAPKTEKPDPAKP